MPDVLPAEIVQRIEQVAADGTKGSVQPFVQPTRGGPKPIGKDRMPNAQEVHIPIMRLVQDYPLIDTRHRAMISKFAKRAIPAGEVRTAHSPGPLLYLAHALATSVPNTESYNYISYDQAANVEISQPIQVSFLQMEDCQVVPSTLKKFAQEESKPAPTDTSNGEESSPARNNVPTTAIIELTESDGQRYLSDARDRVLIERYAMAEAQRYYRDTHDTEDVSQAQPKRGYDLVFRPKHNSRDNRILHVEVKGTQSSGTQVELTTNEVVHARTCAEMCQCTSVLFVVPSIVLEGEGQDREVQAGGTPIVHENWKPHEGLHIVRYRYILPPVGHG